MSRNPEKFEYKFEILVPEDSSMGVGFMKEFIGFKDILVLESMKMFNSFDFAQCRSV